MKQVSTAYFAKTYGRDADAVMRILAKAGVKPIRTVQTDSRTYRTWNRDVGDAAIQEYLRQREAARQMREAKAAEEAHAALQTVEPKPHVEVEGEAPAHHSPFNGATASIEARLADMAAKLDTLTALVQKLAEAWSVVALDD